MVFDDETKELAKEIVRNGALDRVYIALDFFDASINRIAAWVNGMRNMSKSLLFALLQPAEELKKLQDTNQLTKLLTLQEEVKTYPFGDVWNYFCEVCCVPVRESWLEEVEKYEAEVLSKRN